MENNSGVKFIRVRGRVIPVRAHSGDTQRTKIVRKAVDPQNIGAGIAAGLSTGGGVYGFLRNRASNFQVKANRLNRIAYKYAARPAPPPGLLGTLVGKRLIPPDIFEIARFRKAASFYSKAQVNAGKFRVLAKTAAGTAVKILKFAPRVSIAAGLAAGLAAYAVNVALDD